MELYVDPQLVRNVAEEIRKENETFRSYIEQLSGENQSLKQYWVGANASGFANNVEKQVETLEGLKNTFDEIGAALDQVATGFEQLEQDTTPTSFN